MQILAMASKLPPRGQEDPRRKSAAMRVVVEGVGKGMRRRWYHKDDEYGAAGNIPTGKGERLVMLTAITKELGLLCDEDDEKADTLYLFKADKKSGDYHKMMNAKTDLHF